MKPETGRPMSLRLIVALAFLLWGVEYAGRSLWEPDEARFAYVAKEMRQDQRWLVPHRHGVYYAHKPPLMLWMINGFATLSGGDINRVTARLPSLLGAILSLWAVARLAAAWFGPLASGPAVGVLMTSFLFWTTAGMGQMDALLCGLQMAAIWMLFSADTMPAPNARRAAAYLLMGLAVLTKGPVGLLVPLLAHAAARVAAGEGRLLRSRHWLWGVPLALAPVGVWLAAIVLTQSDPPGYLHELIFSQNVGRVAGTFAQGHRRPWWYFIEAFPRDFLPWSLLLPAALAALRRERAWRPDGPRLAGWIMAVLFFFSLSETKRNLYVLLAHPAAALIIAGAWNRLERLPDRWQTWTAAAFKILLTAGGAVLLLAPLFVRLRGVDAVSFWAVSPTGGTLLAGGLLLTFQGGVPALSVAWLRRLVVVLFLAQLSVAAVVYPALNPIKAPDEIRRAAHEHLPPGRPLLLYRINGEIQALYAGARGRLVPTPDALRDALRELRVGMVVFEARDWTTVEAWPEFKGRGHPYVMGRKRLVWAAFDLDRSAPPEMTP